MLSYATLDEAFGPAPQKKSKKVKESFADGPKQERLDPAANATHTAEQSDMNHACRTYGVCPPGYTGPNGPAPKIEGFEANAGCMASAYPQPEDNANAAALQKQMVQMNAIFSSTHPELEKAFPAKPSTSQRVAPGPAPAPLELDDELQSYLNEAQNVIHKSTTSPASPPSLTPAPAPVPERPQSPETPARAPAATATPAPAPAPASAPAVAAAAAGPPKDPYRKWLELALFVAAGILLIFLLEQIFRMGIMVGMKQTTAFIEPFVEYAQNLGSG